MRERRKIRSQVLLLERQCEWVQRLTHVSIIKQNLLGRSIMVSKAIGHRKSTTERAQQVIIVQSRLSIHHGKSYAHRRNFCKTVSFENMEATCKCTNSQVVASACLIITV